MQITETEKKIILDILEQTPSEQKINVGSLLYSENTTQNKLIIVLEGSVRLIDSKRLFGKETIEIVEAPFLFGIGNLLKINLFEEARANSECKYITFNCDDISEEKSNQIFNLYKNKINQFELLSIKKSIENNLSFEKSFREANLSTLKQLVRIFKPEDYLINGSIIYLDKSFQGFKYGQNLTKEICKKFFSEDIPPRLAFLSNYAPQTIDNKDYQANKDSEDFIDKNKKFDNSALTKTKEKNTHNKKIKTSESNKNSTQRDYGFSFIRGKNREDSYFACLSMIVEYFEMPARSDTIRRGAKIINAQGKAWQMNLVNLLDRLGLSVRLVNINLKNPLTIPSPSIWISQDGICNLIIKTSPKYLYIFDPLEGLKLLSAKETRKIFAKSSQIISLEVGLNTPKKRFGIGWLLPYVQKFRTQLIEVFAASFLTQLFQLATPLLFQQIIDRVLSKGANEALSPLIILMLIFSILEITFSSLRTFQFVEISNRIDIGIGSAILSRMLRLNARFFDSRPVGELSSRLNELENIRRFLTGTALTVVLDAIFSVLYFTVMFFYSPLLTLVVMIAVPLLFVVTIGVTPITQKLIRLRAEAQARTNAFLVEILGGIQTIKLQNAELNARRQWEDKHLNSINQGFKAILANTTSSNAGQLINKLSNISVIGVGAWLVLQNELTLGQLIAFRIISGYVTQPMLRLAGSWQQFQEMSLSLQRVGDIVNQPLEVMENEDKNIDMPNIKGSIIAENVSFSYSSNVAPVLNSVNLKIKQGTFVGLVGQSGCGKSSFLKMIPRLYRPTSGKLIIDNFDITKVDLYSLRNQIGFVPQDCMLFEGTIFTNIALGDPEASAEMVVNAAKLACAHEFIMTLPYGYGTPIGEKGAGLSGGQRQRISLARMLLEKPKMVVLDEATSAMDVDTEKQVVTNLRNEFNKKTLVMITHRLSTIVEADQIIVMHEGRVDSTGTHTQLMKQKGRYYALYNSQFNQ